MSRRPFLRLGRAEVVVEPGRRSLTLSGPAVETGVPFHPEPVELVVRCLDEVGKEVAFPPSPDLRVEARGGGVWVLRLARPVPLPRLAVPRRFRGNAPGSPLPYDVSSDPGALVEVRRAGSPVCLWRLASWFVCLHCTWDGAHMWFRVRGSGCLELRRLADGAVMLRLYRLQSKCGTTMDKFCETVVTCRVGCCWVDLGSAEGAVRFVPAARSPVLWSPLGDRAVAQPNPHAFFEFTRADGFSFPRALPMPKPKIRDAYLRPLALTPAGDLVWQVRDEHSFCTWHPSWPQAVKYLTLGSSAARVSDCSATSLVRTTSGWVV